MEHWRAYFGKAGTDIWTLIEQAITLAATDYSSEFKEKRSEIAETLFSRGLLRPQSCDRGGREADAATRASVSVVTNVTTNIREESEERTHEDKALALGQTEGKRRVHHHQSFDDEAEALSDEMEEETLLVKELHHIKETLQDSDQSESAILDCLQRLEYMQLTVEILKATEIGKQVNGFRKHSSKQVQAVVKRLVRNWKDLVDVWVETAKDIPGAAVAGSEVGKISATSDEEQGLPLPPLDEGALLANRTTSLEVSQLFSFMDDNMYGQGMAGEEEELFCPSTHSASTADLDKGTQPWEMVDTEVEPSVKDNLCFSSKSQSGSVLADANECYAKASLTRRWDFKVPERKESINRDTHSGRIERKSDPISRGLTNQNGDGGRDCVSGLSVSKRIAGGSGPGRPSHDTTKARVAWGLVTGRSANESSKTNGGHESQRSTGSDFTISDKSAKASTFNKATLAEKAQADKLESSKRKLYDGYQRAQNAKKQHTMQVLLDLPEIPKAPPVRGKMNPPAQNKSGGGHQQHRRHG